MLEFYPMPTNLNNGGALYPHSHHHNHHATSHHHHQNHGTAARFFDNSNNHNNSNGNSNNNNGHNSSSSNINNCSSSSSSSLSAASATSALSTIPALNDNGNNNISGPQQPHQLLQMMTTNTSPAYASCPPATNIASSRNNTSPISFGAASVSGTIETEASLTPQTLSTSVVATTVKPTSTTAQGNVSAGSALAATSVSATASAAAPCNSSLTKSPSNAVALSSSPSSSSSSTTSSSLSSVAASLSSSSSTASTINPCTVVMMPTGLNSNATLASTQCSSSSSSSSASSSASSSSVSASSSSSSASSSSSSLSLSLSLSSSSSSSSMAVAAALSSSTSSKSSNDCIGRTEVGHIKCEKLFEICEGCGQRINDRYLMNVGDTNWHEQCLACCYCGMQLHHTCYVRNTKLYCKLDYDRLFGIKCAACCHAILPQEMVMRPISNLIFHLSCFICYACRLPLQKGEQFMLRDGQLFCFRHDLEKEMYLAAAQHCGFVGLDDDELMRPRDGRRGPKRPRTILTSQQRKQFKASFDQSPKPCRKVREALAKDTGLSVRVVQVWFQNQRAKMKKIQRKAKNGGSTSGSGANNSRSTDDKDKDKDEKTVKQESVSGSESGYLGLDSTFASQPLNPNLPFSPDDYPANSNDSFCSSDLSLDGSNFDQLDDDADSLSLNNLELQSTGSSGNHNHNNHHHHNNNHHHHHHHHHHHNHHNHSSNTHEMIANLNTSLVNPIDKLYLMQNSYFSSEQ